MQRTRDSRLPVAVVPENKLHADEFGIDDLLVRRLINTQCPQWSSLDIRRVRTTGTDNVIYRLGDQLLVRLPRTPESAQRTRKEHRWLPELGAKLPISIPVPIAMGAPSEDYPSAWSVLPWLPGQTADHQGSALDESSVAVRLAEFVVAMRDVNASDELLPGTHNFFRGVALAERDGEVRAAIAQMANIMDTRYAARAWDKLREVSPWPHRPALIHGDLLPANILVEQGRIAAIIDFGGMGAGDPACDLIPAWTLFSRYGREIFRRRAGLDNDTWLRGQGWALSIGLVALPYYRSTNPRFADLAERIIREVLSDYSPLD